LDEYRKVLTDWYNHSKRELPWRQSRDPYKIWVSEVILQQTRVRQGLDYYHNFLKSFPNVKKLAEAGEEEVLKVWQGLGYYSRARNMHHAAKTILAEHGGKFPEDYLSIRNLKGIGDYTAAAIASISYNLPYAVVDGNVYRVLSRLFGIPTSIDSSAGKKEFLSLAEMMLDKSHPGDSNQALMELGALQCLPDQPACSTCPLMTKCYAFTHQLVHNFPVRAKRVKQKERYLNFLYLHYNQFLFLEKRGDKDIWRNMYQFPLIETTNPASAETVIESDAWKKILSNIAFTIEAVSPEIIHVLTHQRLHIRFFTVRLNNAKPPGHLIAAEKSELSGYPVPKPVENFLLQMGH
jgi:A/G-specific adenine glycosylase